MVGCGNSKLSEDMALDGYPLITNMDISPVVVKKMAEHYCAQNDSKTEFTGFEFNVLDATCMPYRDNAFDFCVDKGTFDALACGPDKLILGRLLQEMTRVSKHGIILISSGTPERRMHFFDDFLGEDVEVEHEKIEVSKLAQLINLLRTELKDKPLSHAMKNDHQVFKKAFL